MKITHKVNLHQSTFWKLHKVQSFSKVLLIAFENCFQNRTGNQFNADNNSCAIIKSVLVCLGKKPMLFFCNGLHSQMFLFHFQRFHCIATPSWRTILVFSYKNFRSIEGNHFHIVLPRSVGEPS